MAIILFLVDTTGSMNQTALTSFGRLTFLDLAKRSIDMFVERRKKIAESRYDRYMLLTFDEPPHNIKFGWNLNESLDTFQKEVSLLEAYSFGSVGLNLKHALDALNIQIIASKLDTSGNNSRLQVANIILITEGRKISSPPSILKELTIPTSPLALDADLSQERNRWDIQFYAIVLRLPGIPVEEEPTFMPPDESDIENLCKASGGRSFSIKHTKILMRSIEYLARNIQQGCRQLENDGPSANESALSALQKKAQEYLIRNIHQGQGCSHLENGGPSPNGPVLSTMEKKAQAVIKEMHSINLKKRLGLDEEPQQTITISSRVNRETAVPSYSVNQIESKFTDFINFDVGVEGKSVPNKQFQIDTMDTPRQKLLDRLNYLRSNFFHFDGRESIDEDIKHNIPISEMMNFVPYMQRIPPALRPVTPKQFNNVTPTLVTKRPIRGPIPRIYTYRKGSPLLRNPVVSSWRSTEQASTSSSHHKETKPHTITSSMIASQSCPEGRKRSIEKAELLSQFENWLKNTSGPKRFKVSEENNIASPGPSSQVDQKQVEVSTITRSVIEENKENIPSTQTSVEQSSDYFVEEENEPSSEVPQPDSEASLSTESASNSNVSVQEEPLDLSLTKPDKMTNEEAELFSQVENWLKNTISQMKFKVSEEENNIASPGPSSQVEQEHVDLCAITIIIEQNKDNILRQKENTVQDGSSTQVLHPDSEISLSTECSSNNNSSVQEEPLDLTKPSAEKESTVKPSSQEEPLDLTMNQRKQKKYKEFLEWSI